MRSSGVVRGQPAPQLPDKPPRTGNKGTGLQLSRLLLPRTGRVLAGILSKQHNLTHQGSMEQGGSEVAGGVRKTPGSTWRLAVLFMVLDLSSCVARLLLSQRGWPVSKNHKLLHEFLLASYFVSTVISNVLILIPENLRKYVIPANIPVWLPLHLRALWDQFVLWSLSSP